MTRLLFVSTSSTVGGAEKTLLNLATRLDKTRFELAGVVSVKPKGEIANRLEASGISVDSLGLCSLPGPSTIRQLAAIIKRTKPDIVHALMYQAIQLCRLVQRRCAAFELVSSPRVNYRSRSAPSLWLDRILKSKHELLISESEASARYLIERLHYDSGRVITIHNGVDAIEQQAGARQKVREELHISPDETLLGAIGRLEEQKGYPYFLEAIAKLRVMHRVRAVIIGEGPMKDELQRLAGELHVADYVRFLAPQPEFSRLYAAMDLFVLPSLWEGLPNAVLEAMSAGLPVVATRVDGIPEAVEDQVSGLLCEPADSQSLFDAVQELIVKPARRQELAEAGRRRVAQKFRMSEMISSYEAAYTRVLSSR